MTELPTTSEELEQALRETVARVDPVPAAVTDFARLALDFRSVDAELAELVYDSAADTELALAVRSGEQPRMLSFEAGPVAVELEVSGAGETRSVRGLLIPPHAAAIELRHRDGTIAVEPDAGGRFAVDELPAGPVSLRLRLEGGATVETEWLPL